MSNKSLILLPAAEKYLRELSKLDQTQLAQWADQKRLEQADRNSVRGILEYFATAQLRTLYQHASRCEKWDVHWSFEPTQDFNVAIVACLAVVLYWLWHDGLQ